MFVVSVQPFQIKLHNFSSSYCTCLLLRLVRIEQTQQAIMELVLLVRIITRTVYTQRGYVENYTLHVCIFLFYRLIEAGPCTRDLKKVFIFVNNLYLCCI